MPLVARLKDSSYQPLEAETVKALWKRPDGSKREVKLKPVPGQPGDFESSVSPREPGMHRIEISDMPDMGTAKIEGVFSIMLPIVEQEKPWMDEGLLKELAEISGGQFFHVDEVSKIASAIPDRRRVVEIPRPPKHLWDRWWVLIALVTLLCGEWALRKAMTMI